MPRASALKVVTDQPFYSKELDFSNAAEGQAHSLHYAVSMPKGMRVGAAAHCLKNFSAPGEVVVDPFCAGGETLLEAALLGRVPRGSDINPLALRVAAAKLHPVDITAVTLKLQQINLRAPIGSKIYSQYFSPFYEINTFREIFNLRKFLQGNFDPASRFIEMLALGLLHGPGAGSFSVYTFPQQALPPAEQLQLNAKRRQVPDYRAVAPRLLRRAAAVTRDGLPSVLQRSGEAARLALRDARDLGHLQSESADLLLTKLPLPSSNSFVEGLWLKLWFAGIAAESFSSALASRLSLDSWLEFMNESLLEMARVLKSGRRAALEIEDVRLKGETRLLDECLIGMVERDLARYWNVEGVLINRERSATMKNSFRSKEASVGRGNNRVLLLKRR